MKNIPLAVIPNEVRNPSLLNRQKKQKARDSSARSIPRNDAPLFSRNYSTERFTLRKRRALVITETELKLIAAAAIMGLSSSPKNG
jgi:hypothetical protein